MALRRKACFDGLVRGGGPILKWVLLLAATSCGSQAVPPKGAAEPPVPVASAVGSAPVVAPAAPEDEFYSDSARIRLTKPHGWHFGAMEDDLENRQRVSFGNAQFDQAVRERSGPLVLVVKHADEVEAANPVIRIKLHPLEGFPGRTALETATAMAGQLKQVIPTFELEREPEEVRVDGRAAGLLVARFSVEHVEKHVTLYVRSRIWLIPRAPNLIVIGMTAPREGEDASEEEFDRVLSSVRIGD